MPKHIHMNVTLVGGRSGEEVSFIETRHPVKTSSYIPWGKLSGCVDYAQFAGSPTLKVAMTTLTPHTFTVDLGHCLDNGAPIRLEIGRQESDVSMADNVNINITLRDSKVACTSSTVHNRRILFGKGQLNIKGGEMWGLFSSVNQYAVPSLGGISLEGCKWVFKDADEWINSNLLSKYTTLSNVTLDGSHIEQLFVKAGFWVSASHGCKAINLDLSPNFALYAPRLNAINSTTKKMAPINPRGMLDNFDKEFISTSN